jgi:biotin synthesis protein BioG
MKTKWLHKSENEKLIVYFAGWSMNGSEVSQLKTTDFDVLAVYDYKDLTFDSELIQPYQEVYIIAWSFGVAVANEVSLPAKKSIAVNGTLKPIDDNFGIMDTFFDQTLATMNEENYQSFLARTFNKTDDRSAISFREIDEQREELRILGKTFRNCQMENHFDLAVISKRDRIFLKRAQNAFWETQNCRTIEITSAHYPFQNWKSWQEIIEL